MAFLLETNEFFGQGVHSLRNNGGLECFSNTVFDSFLVSGDKFAFFGNLGVSFPLFSRSQLSDEVETFLFTFEHHVLHRSASNQTLDKDDSAGLLILLIQSFDRLTRVLRHVDGSVGTHFELIISSFLTLILFILSFLSCVDIFLSFVQSVHMLDLLA